MNQQFNVDIFQSPSNTSHLCLGKIYNKGKKSPKIDWQIRWKKDDV